jgi:hypothetical protein
MYQKEFDFLLCVFIGYLNRDLETISAVMDQLADNAHKVQAAHPECKFPVGVSAKTAEALGWTDEYRAIIREVKGNSSLTENRDFEVSLLQNVGVGLTPR